jgi:aromatic-amino-acid transaminase
VFEALPLYAADPILGIMRSFKDDPRPQKLDLGVGVYRDRMGVAPVMKCVKAAEQHLLRDQSTKSYLGSEGNCVFSSLLCGLIAGEAIARGVTGSRLYGFHTIGGTGALRLAAEILAGSSEQPRIWVGTPTWPNHLQLFQTARLQIKSYSCYDAADGAIDIGRTIDASLQVTPGDAFLLHGRCHNPTGSDLDRESLKLIGQHLAERGAIPVIDVAYAGFDQGFDSDLELTRNFLRDLEEVIICFSCSKTFGLYRERVGLIIVKVTHPRLTEKLRGALSHFALSNYAMPPDHGAAVVKEIICRKELKSLWLWELEEMRSSILRKRRHLAVYPNLAGLGAHNGMFSLLPLSQKACETMRSRFGIYIPDSGRINVLGVIDGAEEYFADSLSRAVADA